jgi:hypothetical protein
MLGVLGVLGVDALIFGTLFGLPARSTGVVTGD